MQQINTVMGEGTIMLGNDPSLVVKYLPTGVLPVDMLLGGGLPRGRFVEIFGDHSALKSYIGFRSIAETQKGGGRCALIDTEHAYDPEWAGRLGVQDDALLVQHPPNGEAAVAVTEVLVREGYDLIVWDSVAATLPLKYQQAKPGEDEQPARLAALMSKACQRLNAANRTTALLWINQTRVNVGMIYGGARDNTPGGKAMGYYASLRVRFTKAGKVTRTIKVHDGEKFKDAKETTGIKVKAVLEKSKLSSPDREVWFDYLLTTGDVDEAGFLMAQGMERGLITGTTWLQVLDRKVQGQPKLRELIQSDREVNEWLRSQMSSVKSPGRLTPPGKSRAVRRKPGS